MKKIDQQQVLTLTLASFLWLFAPQAHSQVIPLLQQIRDATAATANYTNSILTDLRTAGKQALDALTAPTPSIDDTTKANTQIGSGVSKAKSDYQVPLTSKAVTTILSTTANDQPTLLSQITSLPGPDFPSYKSFSVAPSMRINLPTNTEHSPFNIDTLLGTVSFSDGATKGSDDCQSSPGQGDGSKPLCQSYAAQSFIAYASAASNPPVVPAFKTLTPPAYSQTQVSQFRSSPKVQLYLAELRSYTAVQSAGLSNLYHLYAERIIQQGLGKTLNVHKYGTVDANGNIIPGEMIPDVSPLQAEEYLAKRRVYDPAWYKSMESATSPLTLARETLYLLAEMRLEMYKTRMEYERLIATMSVMQLNQMKTQKALLDQQGSMIELPKSS
jgi:hypothetical protein